MRTARGCARPPASIAPITHGYSSTPDGAVRRCPPRLLFLCLLFGSSWLTVEGGRQIGAAAAASPGRAAVAVRVGVAVGVPLQNSRAVGHATSGLLLLGECHRPGSGMPARPSVAMEPSLGRAQVASPAPPARSARLLERESSGRRNLVIRSQGDPDGPDCGMNRHAEQFTRRSPDLRAQRRGRPEMSASRVQGGDGRRARRRGWSALGRSCVRPAR